MGKDLISTERISIMYTADELKAITLEAQAINALSSKKWIFDEMLIYAKNGKSSMSLDKSAITQAEAKRLEQLGYNVKYRALGYEVSWL